MRTLITTPAGLGHIHPMVPLARAMAERGHEVLWAVPADGVAAVGQAGLRAVEAGPAGLTRVAEVMRRYPELGDLPDGERPDVLFGKMFGAMATPPMHAALLPVAREWRPDLVVADAGEFAGHLVAAELGVPSVTKGFGPALPERRVASAGDELAPLWQERGLDPRPYGGAFEHLYLDVYPPGLHGGGPDHIARRQLLRFVAYDGPEGAAATPLPEGGAGRPVVYLTMGTVFNDGGFLRSVVEGLAGLHVRVLVTVGPGGDPAVLGPVPPHVRVERYVPQTTVLPRCDVVVDHGGSGTVLATLALGLPQLCLPRGADQFLNAAAVTAAGAGLSLPPPAAGAAAVSDAVSRLLAEPSFRVASARVAQSIEQMPSPGEVVAVLESVA